MKISQISQSPPFHSPKSSKQEIAPHGLLFVEVKY